MTSILIVDDQAVNRRVLGRLAAQLEDGAAVESFADPAAALDYAQRCVPDLVVTDFNMPVMNGADFIRAFRRLEACKDIPVIVVTAYEDAAYRYRALEAGATDFLLSPVDHREFVTRGRNLLALRASALQKERMAALGVAVAKIHHDLRNVLTSAGLISEYLSETGNEEVQKVAPTLHRAIDRAMYLCSQTLDFVSNDRNEAQKTEFALNDLIGELFGALSVEFEGASLKADIEPETLDVYADRYQLERIIANLTRNALQAGATAVTVSARGAPDATVIDVSDDGPGLPPERRRDMFRPLGASGRRDGTGLGLAITNELVQGHQGTIELVETTDAGTQFRIHLPGPPRAMAAAGGR